MAFTAINDNYQSKEKTHWLRAYGDELSCVHKTKARAEVEQASSLGYGLWRKFGFGPYGCLTLTSAIGKAAEKEMDERIAAMGDAKGLKMLQQAHQIQQIGVRQNALIKRLEGKFCSHFGLLKGALTICGWRAAKLMMNIPCSILGLFDQKVRLRNDVLRWDIQRKFMDLVAPLPALQIWQNTAMFLSTLPDKHIILIQENEEQIPLAEFWVDGKMLQTRIIHKENAEAITLAQRLFTKIQELSSQEEGPSINDLDTIIQGAHAISKLTRLLSIATIIKAASTLNAAN